MMTKSNNWFVNEKTSYEGSHIEQLTSQFGLLQIIKEPTHSPKNLRSCIDLIFTAQQNLVMNSVAHAFFTVIAAISWFSHLLI